MEVADLLRPKKVAIDLALCVAIDSLIVAFPAGLVTGFFSSSVAASIVITGMVMALHAVWMMAWISEWSPVTATIVEGGSVFVILDPAGNIGVTCKGDVVKHPDVPSAIEVNFPGAWLTLDDVKWEMHKPYFRGATIPRDANAIMDLLRQSAKRPRFERPVQSAETTYS